MQTKQYYVVIVALLSALSSLAQTKFVTAGKIEYERKTNQHAFLDDGNVWDDMARKNTSKFITYYFDLVFKDNRTLFKQGRENDSKQMKWWGVFDSENTILSSLDSSKAITQRDIYGDSYLVTDSIRTIDWRITTEFRTIANFNCRKAVGRIMDSIIVIAFYSDEIMTAGGPESFSGLPGMILGLAVPRLHTTWYATKLQLMEVTEKDLAAPKKGKKMAGTAYKSQISEILKQWGDEGKRRIWQFLL